MREPSKAQVIGTHVALLVITVATIFPILWVVRMALTPEQGFSLRLWPDHLSFDNFVAVTTTRSADGTWLFGRQLFNSLVVSFATSLVGVTLATTAGYALSRWSFWGRDRLMATGPWDVGHTFEVIPNPKSIQRPLLPMTSTIALIRPPLLVHSPRPLRNEFRGK